jgi:hypothetical protein
MEPRRRLGGLQDFSTSSTREPLPLRTGTIDRLHPAVRHKDWGEPKSEASCLQPFSHYGLRKAVRQVC